MPDLYPTFTCFDDALEFISDAYVKNKDNAEYFSLVHAICVTPEGKEFSHGWVETDGIVIFGGVLDGEKGYFAADRIEYRSHYRVLDETRYTLMEALQNNLKHGTYGPWEERYLALCSSKGQPHVMINEHGVDIHAIPLGKLEIRGEKHVMNLTTKEDKK